jgi:hypothetical protein
LKESVVSQIFAQSLADLSAKVKFKILEIITEQGQHLIVKP